MCESLRPGMTVLSAPVNYARLRTAEAQNLVILAHSGYLSGPRYGDGFDK